MILVFGATGYTGRLVAQQLAAGEPPFALAGRDRTQLENLASELPRPPAELREADVCDGASLSAMLEGATGIINCVGPFEQLGPPVVGAAASHAVPYCDVTGEPAFIAHVADAHGDAAVPLAPGSGFDYTPHCLAAALAAGAVEEPVRIETGLLAQRFVPTVGTQTSALGALDRGGAAIEDGVRAEVQVGALRHRFEFDGGKRYDSVCYPGGDPLQIHRHFPRAGIVRSYAAVPPGVAWMAGAGFRMMRGLARAGFVQRRFARRNATSNQGPPDEVRKRSRFQVSAEAEGADGGVARALITGSDVYWSTAAIAIALAQRLQRWRELDIPAGFCAPSQVAGDPVAFARECGLELSLLD
ncbi:MAG: saccharopine dehydrogenase NADP-binding domain-containing protein [Myxococcales bacterium]|nr:saccharopine dehydrogenase NADP-binding domain-containing protein [Myxococcales bacterium]